MRFRVACLLAKGVTKVTVANLAAAKPQAAPGVRVEVEAARTKVACPPMLTIQRISRI
jgi:hypothetical protein